MVEKLGSPDYLTPETMLHLAEKAEMEENNEIIFRDKTSDTYTLHETIYPGDVKLIQIFII